MQHKGMEKYFEAGKATIKISKKCYNIQNLDAGKITWTDLNECKYFQKTEEKIYERIDEGVLRRFGHVERMERDRIAKRVCRRVCR